MDGCITTWRGSCRVPCPAEEGREGALAAPKEAPTLLWRCPVNRTQVCSEQQTAPAAVLIKESIVTGLGAISVGSTKPDRNSSIKGKSEAAKGCMQMQNTLVWLAFYALGCSRGSSPEA